MAKVKRSEKSSGRALALGAKGGGSGSSGSSDPHEEENVSNRKKRKVADDASDDNDNDAEDHVGVAPTAGQEEEERSPTESGDLLLAPPTTTTTTRGERIEEGKNDDDDDDDDEDDDDDDDSRCWIRLPERPTAMFPVPDTWWMVDLHADPVPTQGATPLVVRCMRELGWSEATARSSVRAYRQFLRIKAAAEDWDAMRLAPSEAVDQVWRQHVLDTRNYAHDCLLLCEGRFVHRDPDERGVGDAEARTTRLEATRKALLEVYGDEETVGGAGVDRSATGPWKEVFGGGGVGAVGAEQELVAADAVSSGPPAAAETAESVALITIEVELDGEGTPFRVSPTTRMGHVFAAFRRRRGMDPSMSLRFIFEGFGISENDTPSMLGLLNGDRIDAVPNPTGC